MWDALMHADFEYDDDMIAVVQLVQAGGYTSIRVDEACPAGTTWAFLAQQCRDLAGQLDEKARGHDSFIRFDVEDDELDRLLGRSDG
jgi:hypothetical protein